MEDKNLENIVNYGLIEKPKELKEFNHKENTILYYDIPIKDEKQQESFVGHMNYVLSTLIENYSQKDFLATKAGEKNERLAILINPEIKEKVNNYLMYQGFKVQAYAMQKQEEKKEQKEYSVGKAQDTKYKQAS